MDSQRIFEYLGDPVWWFACVIVHFVLTFLGSYVRDGIRWCLALISKKYKSRKQQRDRETREIVHELARDPVLLNIQFLRTIFFCVLYGLSFTFYVIIVFVFTAYRETLSYLSSSQMPMEGPTVQPSGSFETAATIFAVVSFGLAFVSGYTMIRFLRTALRAYREYRMQPLGTTTPHDSVADQQDKDRDEVFS